MVETPDDPRLDRLRERMKELSKRSSQILIFLGFALTATILFWSTEGILDRQQDLLFQTMRWWVLAMIPAVIGLLPVNEIREDNRTWYGFVRRCKFVLLWLTIICIVVGATYFIRSTFVEEPADNTQSTTLLFNVNQGEKCGSVSYNRV